MVADPPGPKVVLFADTLMLAMGWPLGSVTVPVIERAGGELGVDVRHGLALGHGDGSGGALAGGVVEVLGRVPCPWKSENWTV